MGLLRKVFGKREDADWQIVSAHVPGTSDAAILRLRTKRPPGATTYPNAIEITWNYVSDSAFPESQDTQQMASVVSRLNPWVELLEVDTGIV
jgi:hypothetical protein